MSESIINKDLLKEILDKDIEDIYPLGSKNSGKNL